MQNEQQQEVQVVANQHEEVADLAMIKGGGITATVLSIVAGLMWFRRRMARDSLEVNRDRSESNLLTTILDERNAALAEAKEAWARATKDAALIGKLSAQVESLEQLNHKTNNEVHLLRLLNEKMQKEVNALNNRMERLTNQISACMNCPLRGKSNVHTIEEVEKKYGGSAS